MGVTQNAAMARLPTLVRCLAECDGREVATVDHWARTVREHGYIETTKRGAGASNVTTSDAAKLLIALNCAPTAAEACRSLPSFLLLAPAEPAGRPLQLRFDPAMAFGEALRTFIELAPKIAGAFPPAGIRVAITTPPGLAIIEISQNEGRFGRPWRQIYRDAMRPGPTSSLPDRRVTAEFGLPTLLSLHRCVSGAASS
jgi:hypothetical protein